MHDRVTTDLGVRSLALTEAVVDTHARADWAGLRALCHDDALLCTVAAQHEILTPDALIVVLAKVTSESIYAVDGTSVSAIDDIAALVTGQVRYPLAGGGFGDGSRAWVLTYRDDRLYRMRPFPTLAKARAAYAKHGIDLGVHSAARGHAQATSVAPVPP